MSDHRNPRSEAEAVIDDPSLTPLLLEPAPPADPDPGFYADDPTVPDAGSGQVISPIGNGQETWTALVDARPEVGEFARTRWLGNFGRLQSLSDSYTTTRQALHQIAFFAVAPKRHDANGKIGLRYTMGGFGTPFFGDDEQVRVVGARLIHQARSDAASVPITTVGDACEFLGIPYTIEWFADLHDPLQPVGASEQLTVDPTVAAELGNWFGFATSVLEEARRFEGAVDVSRVQLWCEHFDPAMEMGSSDAGQRASYGASPGDGQVPEPYLYVAPWNGIDDDPHWNADGFGGAILHYRDLLAVEDQRRCALEFFRKGWEKLSS